MKREASPVWEYINVKYFKTNPTFKEAVNDRLGVIYNSQEQANSLSNNSLNANSRRAFPDKMK